MNDEVKVTAPEIAQYGEVHRQAWEDMWAKVPPDAVNKPEVILDSGMKWRTVIFLWIARKLHIPVYVDTHAEANRYQIKSPDKRIMFWGRDWYKDTRAAIEEHNREVIAMAGANTIAEYVAKMEELKSK